MENMNGMMPNGMPGPAMNTMQRPQPGNAMQQIHAKIMESLRAGQGFFQGGWQATMDIRLRAAMIVQLVTALRALEKDTLKCINIAETWEKRTIAEAANQDMYKQAFQAKLGEVKRLREQQANKIMPPGQMGNNMAMMGDNNMMNMQNGLNQMQGFNAMGNMNPMGAMVAGNFAQQNNAFNPQMSAGQMPPNQMQRSQSSFMNPAALQNPGMQPGMPNMNQANPQQQNNAMNPGPQGVANQLNQQEVQKMARTMFEQIPEPKKAEMRQKALAQMPEQARQTFRGDPLMVMLMKTAANRIRGAAQGPQGQQMAGGNLGMANQGMNGNMSQMGQGNGNQNFNDILNQYQNGLRQQDSGELVVPASNNPNGMNLGAPGMNPNQQMFGNNPMMQNQLQQMHRAQQEKSRREQLAQQTRLAQQNAQFAAQRNQQVQQAQQAQQQNNQLTGQPGGLNGGPTGQVNSPAMPNLNRPIVPPGVQTPVTPQQNIAGGIPTPNNDTSQMQQSQRNMMSGQNNQPFNMGNMGGINPQNPALQNLIRAMPPQIREKLQTMNPSQIQQLLQRYQQQAQNGAGNAGSQQPTGFNMNNQGNNIPNMANNQQEWNNNNNGNNNSNNNNNNNNNGMPPNMANGMPNVNPQMNIGNHPPAAQPNPRQIQMQQLRQRAMDNTPFPKQVLTSLNNMKVPAAIQSWGQLKMHCAQNSAALGQNMMQQVILFQQRWFASNPQHLEQAMRHYMQQQQQQQPNNLQVPNLTQNNAPGNQAPPMRPQTSQGGQAPPAPMGNAQVPTASMAPPTQMVQAPNAPTGQPLGGPFGNLMGQIQPPTPADIQMFRQRFPNLAQASDDEVKRAVMNAKLRNAQENQMRQQQQAALRNAQQQQQNAMNQPGNVAPQIGPGNQQPPRPRPTPQNGGMGLPPGPQLGQKRPADGDLNDMGVAVAAAGAPNGAPQAPAMQPTPSQRSQAPPNNTQWPSQQQLAQMSIEERARWFKKAQTMKQLEQIKRGQPNFPVQQPGMQNTAQAQAHAHAQAQAQMPASQPQPPQVASASNNQVSVQLRKRLEELWQETQRSTPKRAPVNLDGQSHAIAEALLKQLYPPMKQVSSAFAVALHQKYFDEERIKEMMKCQVLVSQNFDQNGNVSKQLTLDANELRGMQATAKRFFQELKERQAQAQSGQNVQQVPTANTQAAAPKVTNKQQQQQTGAAAKSAAQNRKASTSNKGKPPSAPTDEKAPEVPWGVSSPHGVPNYGLKGNELTPDKLKIPPVKKRKGTNQADSAASTPAGAAGTPMAVGTSPGMAINKVASPEQMRKTPSQLKQEQMHAEALQRFKFRCSDETCERSITGFETQEELQKHTDSTHQEITDPFDFLINNAALALGVDQDGNYASTTKPQARKPATIARQAVKQEGQTPITPAAAGTPATPGSSSKAVAKASTTPGSRKATGEPKTADATATSAEPPKEKTLRETLAEKIGFGLQDMQTGKTDAVTRDEPVGVYNNDQAWQEALASTLADSDDFETFLNLGGAAADDVPIIDDWGLRPDPPVLSPSTTPSDGSSQSSHESDISLNERLVMNLQWDPFGTGDNMVPEVFQMQKMDLGASPSTGNAKNASKDGKENDGDTAANATSTEDDGSSWSHQPDFGDWEAMFGPNAGLDGNGSMDWLST